MRFAVRADTKAMQRDLTKVQRKLVPPATVQALNKAAAAVRTQGTRQIARVKQISPQRLVRERLRIRKANRTRLVATVTALLLGIQPRRLGTPRKIKAGVAVKRHRFAKAFLATMPSGHFGVWERTGKPKIRPKQGRYKGTGILREPIREVFVPLQPEAEGILNAELRTTGARTWKAEFERQMRWRLEKLAGR